MRILVYLLAYLALLNYFSFAVNDTAPVGDSESIHSSPDLSACNGYKELCKRSYDKISTAVTHNSFALTPNPAGNQNVPIEKQLQDGIRGLMLDLHVSTKSSEALRLCHGDCKLLDAGAVSDTLTVIKTFLDKNPFEVVTLFIENFAHIKGDMIARTFETSGLVNMTRVQKPQEPWPTLEEMIKNNTRLVVFINEDITHDKYPWLLYEYDFLWETPFSVPVNSSFNCDVDRPKDTTSAMYLINHFVFGQLNIGESGFEIPAASHAPLTNGDQLQNHVKECREERNQTANFVAVDFYEVGDIFRVVAELNEVKYIPVVDDLHSQSTEHSGGTHVDEIEMMRVLWHIGCMAYAIFINI
ncbi:hypothetical protein K7432_012861 [Basidiobolus ranarum]|uniref:PLC-like phosphodiesterase n=1 Tax=Basidiobolus ranarum TaxID=34480 RepID=A0ABR2WK54_9FUNG